MGVATTFLLSRLTSALATAEVELLAAFGLKWEKPLVSVDGLDTSLSFKALSSQSNLLNDHTHSESKCYNARRISRENAPVKQVCVLEYCAEGSLFDISYQTTGTHRLTNGDSLRAPLHSKSTRLGAIEQPVYKSAAFESE
jgi:hypothetical protein